MRNVTPTAPLPRIFRFMDDTVLDSAIADLERVTSQEAFTFAPLQARANYLEALDAARAEVERRRS